MYRRIASLALALAVLVPCTAESQSKKSLTTADLQAWKTIRNPDLSADGRWLAYILAPNEGDANVVIKSTEARGKEYTFPIGEVPGPGGGAPGGAGSPMLQISEDSKWAAFLVNPTRAEGRRARTARRPIQTKVAIVNLATGEKREYDKIRRFVFAGESPRYLALSAYPAGAPAAPAATAAGGAAPAPSAPSASDLLLLELATGTITNIGNVGEFGFDKFGHYLAYTIDARDQIGNGVQLRDLRTDVVKSLDSDQALYRRLVWVDSGYGLAVLRGRVDSVARDTTYTVLAFTGMRAPDTRREFDAKGRTDFPAGMKVAADRAPRFSTDLAAVFFGIREAKKPAPAERTMAGTDSAARSAVIQGGAPGAGGTVNQPRVDPNDETPSLIIWHHRDPRLQSQQIVQENADRAFTYLSEFRFADNRFIRLADDTVRNLFIGPMEKFAMGNDNQPYQQQASYNGRNFSDVYLTDLRTGVRRRVLEKHLNAQLYPSPDGTKSLYWGHDGHWYVLDHATGAARNLTQGAPVSFVNVEDDHNTLYPPPYVLGNLGWSKDNQHVLLNDGWDIWRVPVARGGGASAVNLTGNGRRTEVRYSRVALDLRERGIDLAKPLYFSTYGEWTKRMGLARHDGRSTTILFEEDARFSFGKARYADTFILTRQTAVDFPDYYVADASFANRRRLTDANPQQKDFLWSAGVRLVDYTSEKGDRLQGALYLPSDYQPGRTYPLLVTIYEKRSQNAHVYVTPNETSTPNRSLYTSKGYAVLDPDIVYKLNDPGMSAVWAVLPAVKAAIATGVVDSTKVGLWGHSWGGYQTSFLVTQTKLFKAAIAGAPLTDLVSMYSSIYWNTGGTNQAIFESSQGRFKGNFIEHYDAYIRNSPAFHAKNVETPLVIMHNDKDGAVDFNQGITYYNTLRQLEKDVILLEYVGENHGLARPANQKDYAQRMSEWFDHYLRGMPAPEWMVKGVPRLKMEEHLRERREEDHSRPPTVPRPGVQIPRCARDDKPCHSERSEESVLRLAECSQATRRHPRQPAPDWRDRGATRPDAAAGPRCPCRAARRSGPAASRPGRRRRC
jgi:dipeptidyl aminopeptidase/acylaminoacyl peptidase